MLNDWLNCTMDFDKWISPQTLSAIAAIFSAAAAFLMYQFTKKQNKREYNNDLYNVIIHFAGFVNYVQVLYQYHDVSPNDIENLIRQLCNNEHKNILSIDQKFYFNDRFDEAVIINIGHFMESYLAWQAFYVGQIEEVFVELDMMLKVQEKAIDVLATIRDSYENDNKISNIIDNNCNNLEDIKSSCEDVRDKLQYISQNLLYVFRLDRMRDDLIQACNLHLDWNGIRRAIVIGCLSDILSGEIEGEPYAEAKRALFEAELIPNYEMQFLTKNGMRVEWRQIYLYLWHFIGDPTERLDELSHLQHH